MAERVREGGGMIENQTREQVSEALNQSERATDALVQPNSTVRNNSNQPNPRSSSLTPLSSNSPSPRRRPTPRSASPSQQYSTQMSLSPRSNSTYEKSPDTTLSSTAFGALGDVGSIMKERLRRGSEEIELDYGESGDEMEVETRKPKVDDTSEVQHAQKEEDEARSPDSSHLRQSPSTYIASPWQRRRSLSSPRPRSPSTVSIHHFAPTPSAPPHTASLSPNVSHSIPPPRLTPISLPAPEMIRLHLCLPRDLPAASLSHYFNTISPPFEIYEETLSTSQPAAMGFIIVEKSLWDNGEIQARVKRRGDMQFGFGGKRTWGIKLTLAKDQLFSSRRLYEQAWKRRAERERERRAEGWVGMILEGFGKGVATRIVWKTGSRRKPGGGGNRLEAKSFIVETLEAVLLEVVLVAHPHRRPFIVPAMAHAHQNSHPVNLVQIVSFLILANNPLSTNHKQSILVITPAPAHLVFNIPFRTLEEIAIPRVLTHLQIRKLVTKTLLTGAAIHPFIGHLPPQIEYLSLDLQLLLNLEHSRIVRDIDVSQVQL